MLRRRVCGSNSSIVAVDDGCRVCWDCLEKIKNDQAIPAAAKPQSSNCQLADANTKHKAITPMPTEIVRDCKSILASGDAEN